MAKKPKTPKTPKVKVLKRNFPKKTAKIMNDEGQLVEAFNDKGLLTAVPVKILNKEGEVIYAGYDPRKFQPLKKADFATTDIFMVFQAMSLESRANRMLALAQKKRDSAERFSKYGDEATRKKALKVARMRETVAKLEAELAEQGLSADDITE